MTGHAEVFVQALERLEKSPLDGAEQSHLRVPSIYLWISLHLFSWCFELNLILIF